MTRDEFLDGVARIIVWTAIGTLLTLAGIWIWAYWPDSGKFVGALLGGAAFIWATIRLTELEYRRSKAKYPDK